jgi:hypothetical protein
VKTEDDILVAIAASPFHMQCLASARELNLPGWCIGAGFVRNLVWDRLHGFAEMTPLNDVDVLYYDRSELSEPFEKECERWLELLQPGPQWSVKNQARMHIKFGSRPYVSMEDALRHWLETVTPVAVTMDAKEHLTLIAPLGIEDLLNCTCHPTRVAYAHPERLAQYKRRMKEKNWPGTWSKVRIFYEAR